MWITRKFELKPDHSVPNPDRIVIVASLVCLSCFLLSVAKDSNFGVVQANQTPVTSLPSVISD
jgi:hypothetical protein